MPGELTDDALESRLFARAGVKQGQRRRHEPKWAQLSIELKKPGVTAKAESFMKTLKVEAVYPMAYETFEEVTEHLPHFIDEVYNNTQTSFSARLSEPASVANTKRYPVE
ncbi:hypothetical protein [Ensifer adhaerens]|uniref:hypothetical protein n=1 Tax=Ensifer adhaerens TaxID=106592 RepID=UPI003B84908E